jgi:hypothetical protein
MNGDELYIKKILKIYWFFSFSLNYADQISGNKSYCNYLPETTILIRAEPIKLRSQTVQKSDLL